jgi:hypothetical protein
MAASTLAGFPKIKFTYFTQVTETNIPGIPSHLRHNIINFSHDLSYSTTPINYHKRRKKSNNPAKKVAGSKRKKSARQKNKKEENYKGGRKKNDKILENERKRNYTIREINRFLNRGAK